MRKRASLCERALPTKARAHAARTRLMAGVCTWTALPAAGAPQSKLVALACSATFQSDRCRPEDLPFAAYLTIRIHITRRCGRLGCSQFAPPGLQTRNSTVRVEARSPRYRGRQCKRVAHGGQRRSSLWTHISRLSFRRRVGKLLSHFFDCGNNLQYGNTV